MTPAPTLDFDHVALGLRDITDTLFTLVGRLGAGVVDGGEAVGFRMVQVRLGRAPDPADPSDHGEGMKVELMEPWAAERFDFLTRFLDRSGDGPHHMTFKTERLVDEIDRLEAAGYSPVRTQLTNPWWREAFYHPKQTFGTVIQLAEPRFDPDLVAEHERAHEGEMADFGSVEWWPAPPARAEPRAMMRRVVLGVPDPLEAAAFFGEVLGGTATAASSADAPRGAPIDEADGIEIAWPGGGRLLLEAREGPPGIERYECERAGAPEELVVGGVKVRISPAES